MSMLTRLIVMISLALAGMLGGCDSKPPATDDDFVGSWDFNADATRPGLNQSYLQQVRKLKAEKPKSYKDLSDDEIKAISEKVAIKVSRGNHRYVLKSDRTAELVQTKAAPGQRINLPSKGTWTRDGGTVTLTFNTSKNRPTIITREGERIKLILAAKEFDLPLLYDRAKPGIVDADVYGSWVIDPEPTTKALRASLEKAFTKAFADKKMPAMPTPQEMDKDAAGVIANLQKLDMRLKLGDDNKFVMENRKAAPGGPKPTSGTWACDGERVVLTPTENPGLSGNTALVNYEAGKLRVTLPGPGSIDIVMIMKAEPPEEKLVPVNPEVDPEDDEKP